MRLSLRALNRCRDCQATFEAPYGEDLASRCPSCNSPATEVVSRSATRTFLDSGLACFILALVIVAGVGIGAAALGLKGAWFVGKKAVRHAVESNDK